MTKNTAIPFLFSCVIVLLFSCQQYSETFQVIRQPSIQAEVNEEPWSTRTYTFTHLGQVVHYDAPNATEARIFERIRLTGFRSANSLERLEIVLDVPNARNLLGTYTPLYTDEGGIHALEWIEPATSPRAYPLYRLCAASDATTSFVVERQNTRERIISGTFETILCERANEAEQVIFTEGRFRDLNYGRLQP